MNRRLAAMILASVALAGCAEKTPEPEIRTQRVLIEKPVPCTPEDFPSAPTYPDNDAALQAALTPEARYALVIAGRLLRIARLEKVEAVVESCREIGQ